MLNQIFCEIQLVAWSSYERVIMNFLAVTKSDEIEAL